MAKLQSLGIEIHRTNNLTQGFVGYNKINIKLYRTYTSISQLTITDLEINQFVLQPASPSSSMVSRIHTSSCASWFCSSSTISLYNKTRVSFSTLQGCALIAPNLLDRGSLVSSSVSSRGFSAILLKISG